MEALNFDNLLQILSWKQKKKILKKNKKQNLGKLLSSPWTTQRNHVSLIIYNQQLLKKKKKSDISDSVRLSFIRHLILLWVARYNKRKKGLDPPFSICYNSGFYT